MVSKELASVVSTRFGTELQAHAYLEQLKTVNASVNGR
jgi:hypothetical protein